MALQVAIHKKTFRFRFDARTSRGTMKNRESWFVRIWDSNDPRTVGIGEAAPLAGLSVDYREDFSQVFGGFALKMADVNLEMDILEQVRNRIPSGYSSITCAYETALLDLTKGGRMKVFDGSFFDGRPIPINGLIWMGDADFMLKQAEEKIAQGYTCLKLKIGGIDFEEECRILSHIRSQFSDKQLTIRLDANGSFNPKHVYKKLERLSAFGIHSIEQPLPPNSPLLSEVCRKSPIPVALDEELIGRETEKETVLDRCNPQYIILKPTLHGGFLHTTEWIHTAEQRGIGWWITSALESNVGLNAICQFTSQYPVELPQGLGTGSLYDNNFASPLVVTSGHIRYGDEPWVISLED